MSATSGFRLRSCQVTLGRLCCERSSGKRHSSLCLVGRTSDKHIEHPLFPASAGTFVATGGGGSLRLDNSNQLQYPWAVDLGEWVTTPHNCVA